MGSTSNNKTRPDIVNRKVHQTQAIELRMGGASYSKIAKAMGISPSGAHKLVMNGLRDEAERQHESTKQLRQIEVRRMNELYLAIWSKAKAGNMQAIDRALRISERVARLCGLDAPQKLQMSGEDGGPVQVAIRPDFSQFSLAELEQFRALAAKAKTAHLPAPAQDVIVDVDVDPPEVSQNNNGNSSDAAA